MSGIEAIAAERQRQIEKEGWTLEHDDEHTDGSLAAAAACYAYPIKIILDVLSTTIEPSNPENDEYLAQIPVGWPESWDCQWWKPKSYRENLVRAGALIAAEIDRLDRLENAQPEEDG